MVRGEVADQLGDAVSQLEREVRRRGAHELAHVLDGDVVAREAGGILGFAHDWRLEGEDVFTGTISSSESSRD
jgi:hypothetical protein